MARHERERLRRGPVQPLRIVDDADKRTLSGYLRQQAQDGQADRERSGASPPRRLNAVPSALRCGSGSRSIRSRNGAHN